jgi:hypothetical protein
MRAVLLAASALIVCLPACAQEDDDLNRIPSAVDATAAPPDVPATRVSGSTATLKSVRSVVENAFTSALYRDHPAVPLSEDDPAWADRLSLDAMVETRPAPSLSLNFGGRLNALEGAGVGTGRVSFGLDWREAYASWQAWPQTYFEAGRINQRSGVAFGFNPTDFFKGRTAVSLVSADPGSARENRLGAVMVRMQTYFSGGSFLIAYAPKLNRASALYSHQYDGFSPHFDRTNAADRVLVAFGVEIADLSPQVSVYHADGRTKLGLNLSHALCDSVVIHGEWAGGNASNLYDEAVAYGKKTGTLPAIVSAATARHFRNEAAAGLTWTGADKVSLTLEYDYREAGFTGRDWHDWFAAGKAMPSGAGVLWYVRGYASEMQLPISRNQIFYRAAWDDAVVAHLSLSAVGFVSPYDGSAMAQIAAAYDLTDLWSVSVYAGGYFGGTRSEWGSLHQAASVSLRLARYL